MNYQEFVPNLIGMIGVSLVLLAYALLQINYWMSCDFLFSLANLLGALCILFSLLFNWNLASVTIEVVWILISLYRIFLFFRESLSRKNKRTHSYLSKISLQHNRQDYFTPLKSPEIHSFLEDLGDNWSVVNENFLKKTWLFDTYQKSMDFVNKVTERAEMENHHPVFFIEYKKVTITIWTHNINALTQADYILASKISDCSPSCS